MNLEVINQSLTLEKGKTKTVFFPQQEFTPEDLEFILTCNIQNPRTKIRVEAGPQLGLQAGGDEFIENGYVKFQIIPVETNSTGIDKYCFVQLTSEVDIIVQLKVLATNEQPFMQL